MTKEQMDKWIALGFPFDPEAISYAADESKKMENNVILSATATKIPTPNEFEQKFKLSVKLNTMLSQNNRLEIKDKAKIYPAYLDVSDIRDTRTYVTEITLALPSPALVTSYPISIAIIDVISNKSVDAQVFNLKIEDQKKELKTECFCRKQGLVNFDCQGKGDVISDEMYDALAEELNIEKEILLAIAKQESKRSSFTQLNPKKASILFERHHVYDFVLKKYGKARAKEYQKADPNLCHPDQATNYGSYKDQLVKLEQVKKWDETIAIKSCSWGKFQVLGEYFEKGKTFKAAADFESAMNTCEIQHFAYLRFFIITIKGDKLIAALKNKNWEKIAEFYNGGAWRKINPNYAKNIQKYYEEFKK